MSSITQAGRDLLAMATALDRLVFSKAYMLTASYTDVALSSMTTMPDVSTAPVGAIKNVVFMGGECRATAEFMGGANSNFATVIMAARLESQSDSQAIPFCGFNDGDIYSPPSGGLNTYIDIDFYLSFLDDSASVTVTTAAAAPVAYVDTLRNDIYNGGTTPARVYRNFLEAQCHALEGESAFIEPTGPDVFYINIPSYPSTGSFTKHRIADFCDHILAILLYDSSYTYVEFFDMRDATISGQAITLPAPFVRAQLGDESSTEAFVKIAKIDNMYFAIAYNNCSSSNQWWYNSTVGQTTGEKIVGNCAAMPLDAYVVPRGSGTEQLTKGRWYGIDSASGSAMRALNGDLVLFTTYAKGTNQCYISRITPSVMVISGTYVLFSRTDLMPLDYSYIDKMFSSGTGKYIDTCAASIMADGNEIALVTYYDLDGYSYSYLGCMIQSRTVVQEMGVTPPNINNSFYSIYGINGYDFNETIQAATNFSYPGTYPLIYRSGKGLWIAVNGYWMPFESALVSTLIGAAGSNSPDTPMYILVNGQELVPLGETLASWGAQQGPVVMTEYYGGISSEMLKNGVNITVGQGLVCGWAVSNTSRLWLMYVKDDPYKGYTVAMKKDGMI